ncbi:hypothetical protein [uncultured Cocleimonas sp.]|uniref:hypothetical protein n=1 Tax=uncultured Cocleimonas sp. TaxID=1051587 RepID=UPI00260524F1|nr:hypothetical protein [uncultured Cocleimonas sp.]
MVELPDGLEIARERSSLKAWNKAKDWILDTENIQYNNIDKNGCSHLINISR